MSGLGARTSPARVEVLGVGLDPSTLDEAADRILAAVDRRTGAYVCVRDVHGVVLCQDDPELLAIHRRAELVTTDGMPLVQAVRRAGNPTATRVYGPDLMLQVCGRRVGGLRHYLYGSTPEVLADLRSRLETRFPGLAVVGSDAPPFRPLTGDESEAERARIRAARPDIVWVGLSTPKQERWMAATVDEVGGAVLIGVGAAFDLHAGRKPQAPGWMRRAGFEWAFRMLVEPRRLGRRYLSVIPRFLWASTRERLARRPRNIRTAVVAVIAWATVVGAWALAAPHGAVRGIERVLVAVWCTEDSLERCAPPLLTAGSDAAPTVATRLVPGRLLVQDCFGGAPDRSPVCLDEPGTVLGGGVEVPLRELDWRPDVPTTRIGGPVAYLRFHGALVTAEVDASLARMRRANVLIAVLVPALVFAIASPRVRRGMVVSSVTLVPLGLALLGSLDTSAWTVVGALVTWAATLTVLERLRTWRRVAAGGLAVVGGTLLLTPVAADPMRTGTFLALSVLAALALRVLDVRPSRRVSQVLAGAAVGALGVLALLRAFRPLPWEAGVFLPGRSFRALVREFTSLPAAVGDLVGLGPGLGHFDTRVSGWAASLLLLALAALLLWSLTGTEGPRRWLLVGLAVMTVLQMVHVPLSRPLSVDAELFTGRHHLPLVVLLMAVAGASSQPAPAGPRGRRRRSWTLGTLVATLAVAHASALQTQISRYATQGWWWVLPPGPRLGPTVVLILGSAAFVVLGLLAVRNLAGSPEHGRTDG